MYLAPDNDVAVVSFPSTNINASKAGKSLTWRYLGNSSYGHPVDSKWATEAIMIRSNPVQ
jgi:hypothetical protein